MTSPTPDLEGLDLLDGRIGNPRAATRAALDYRDTPSFAPELIASARAQGRISGSIHLGGGIWASLCPQCDAYVRTYDHLLSNPELVAHRLEAHGTAPAAMLR